MGLPSDKKRATIDNVQARINKWIGRPYMTVHEAIFCIGNIILFRFGLTLR